MLSNTDERSPSPKVEAQDGAGKALTGMREAAATSATRKSAPFRAGRATDQSGLANGAVTSRAAQTASPSQGAVSSPSLRALAVMLVTTAAARMKTTIQIRRH